MVDTAGLAELAALADQLGPAVEPPGALQQLTAIVEAARELLGAASASVAIVDREQEALEFLAATAPAAEHVVGLRVPLGQGIAGFVAASGQSLTVSDTAQDPRFASEVAAGIGYVPSVLLAVPLTDGDEVIGVMEVLDPTAEPDGDVSRLLGILADQAALTLQTMIVFTDLGSALLLALAARLAGSNGATSNTAHLSPKTSGTLPLPRPVPRATWSSWLPPCTCWDASAPRSAQPPRTFLPPSRPTPSVWRRNREARLRLAV